ncbi:MULTISPECIES: MFS transporter [unclassified Fusibacter]|uniref:MFS transporter n=1 Tax=unclassified Fusibacter TaxID=2624464 RepID=UPI0010113F8B|nr:MULTISPECIES: MFS transporter [unclassified Fusibacter]MCK8060479.1 MFS transporter [Fusibacter sp. A2]NPE20232.1 MFS transporter [Fusibacter sp. A1]RXV63440.1 MFS transporter [Fusibacter sp. A1]
MQPYSKLPRSYKIFLAIVAFSALGFGLTSGVLSNYFKEVYDVSAYQRGLIEFPRETPGVLAIIFIALLSRFSDIRLSIIAQLLAIVGVMTLGLVTPPFGVMLIFIFINSAGHHLNMPLQDSIGMSLITTENAGRQMGQYKGIQTAFAMIASAIIFVGFRFDVFSFDTGVKWIFVVSAGISLIAVVFLIVLDRLVHDPIKTDKRINFVFRKEYKYYYTLVVMYGVQKQIMLVYGPWVLISLLDKKADTLAILGIIGSFIGMFFIPKLGAWIDRFGTKKLLFADALSFIGVYLVYGFISAGFSNGTLDKVGLPVLIAYGIFIIDRMSNQMGMIRTLYLRQIAVEKSDIMPTLSLGLSLDHIVSILCAVAGGVIWGAWGPEYIFYLTAALSLVNLFVAVKVKI